MDKDPNTPMRGIPVPGRQVPGLTTSTPARTSTIPLIMQLNDSDSDDEEGVEEVEDSDNEGKNHIPFSNRIYLTNDNSSLSTRPSFENFNFRKFTHNVTI